MKSLTVALAASCLVLACNSGEAPTIEARERGEVLALVGGTIHPSPTQAPILEGVVLVRSDTIVEVGTREAVSIPADARLIDFEGMHLFAGFQNSHVHFSEAKWQDADSVRAEQLSLQLEQMLLRYGFTTVVDTGSELSQTVALRGRIETGEIRGPRILTAGAPIYPHNGVPFYL